MYFEFREAMRAEQDACFQLREASYRASPTLRGSLEKNGGLQNFSKHDDHSRHFGLFQQDALGSQLIGYARVVEAFPENPTLPCPSCLAPDRAWRMRRMVNRLITKHGMMVEAGRLSVEQGVQHRSLAKHTVESLCALWGLGFQAPALVLVATHHQRYYESMGFMRVLRNESLLVPETLNTEWVCMLRQPTACAGAARLAAMLRCYARFGAIANHPENRDDLVPGCAHPESLQSLTRLALLQAA